MLSFAAAVAEKYVRAEKPPSKKFGLAQIRQK